MKEKIPVGDQRNRKQKNRKERMEIRPHDMRVKRIMSLLI